MRRLATLAILPCSVVLFVAFAATAGADDTIPTTPTIPPPIDEPTTIFPSTTPPNTKLIQPGVTIGGVLVGGFTKAEARSLVLERFNRPVTLVVSPTRKLRLTAKQLGASVNLGKAVGLAARVRRQGYRVPLDVDVTRGKLDRFLSGPARKTDREPVDAALVLKGVHPVARKSAEGRRLKQVVAGREITLALRKHLRDPIALPYQALRPEVTEHDLDTAIVIERGSNRLLFYKNLKLNRTFHVATGQARTQRRSGTSRSSTCSGTRGGTPHRARRGPRASSPSRRGRATRSGRAGWASPRRTSASTGRPTQPPSAIPHLTGASAC